MVKLLCSDVLLRILGRGQTNPFATKRPWFSDLPNPLIWFCVWVHTKKMDDTIKIRVVYHQVPHEKGKLIIECIHMFLHILNPYQYFSNHPGTPWNHHFCTDWYRKVLRRHDEFPSNFRLISLISLPTDTDCIIYIYNNYSDMSPSSRTAQSNVDNRGSVPSAGHHRFWCFWVEILSI